MRVSLKVFTIVILLVLTIHHLGYSFNLYVGQDKSEVIAALGQPNYTEVSVNSTGKVERCQWGSERVGGMLVIYFKNEKIVSFQTKGEVK